MEAVLSLFRPLHVKSLEGVYVKGLLLFPALLLLGSHFNGDYQNWQWGLGLVMALMVPNWQLYPEKFSVVTIAMAYFLFHSLYTSFLVLSQDKSLLLLVFAWTALLSFLAASQLARWFNSNGYAACIGYFGLANATYVAARSLCGVPALGGRQNGFIDYCGLNGALIAVTWPFLMDSLQSKHEKVIATLIVLGALWLGAANIPYFVFAVVVGSYVTFKYKRVVFASAVASGVFLLAFVQGFRHVSGFDRLEAYKMFMGVWAKHFSWTFGSGAGSFRALSGLIQSSSGYGVEKLPNNDVKMMWWPTLHSDWLQTLFEFGVVGLVLATAVYFVAVYKLYEKKEFALLSMLLGIGVTAIGDYPLKYFVFELLGAIAICRAIQPEAKCLQR